MKRINKAVDAVLESKDIKKTVDGLVEGVWATIETTADGENLVELLKLLKAGKFEGTGADLKDVMYELVGSDNYFDVLDELSGDGESDNFDELTPAQQKRAYTAAVKELKDWASGDAEDWQNPEVPQLAKKVLMAVRAVGK